jgi:hypothetical protein
VFSAATKYSEILCTPNWELAAVDFSTFAGTAGANVLCCKPGTFLLRKDASSAAACAKCPPGKFQNKSKYAQATNCTSCAAGLFQEFEEKTSCDKCPLGFHQRYENKPFCLPCFPGKHQDDEAQPECKFCAAGRFMAEANATACEECPGGWFSSVGQATCTTCPAGWQMNGTLGEHDCVECSPGSVSTSPGDNCTACELGRYSGQTGQSVCLPCIPGEFSNETGLQKCHECAIGKVSKDQNASSCTDCDAGQSSDLKGSAKCTSCNSGAVAIKTGMKACIECNPGRFQSTKGGNASCEACPAGWTSAYAGAPRCLECEKGKFGKKLGMSNCTDCAVGQYRDSSSNKSSSLLQTCLQCPTGYSTSTKTGQSSCGKTGGLTAADCATTTQFLNNKKNAKNRSSTCDACPRGGACNNKSEWHDIARPANDSEIKALFGWSRCSPRGGATDVKHMFERCPFAAACLGAPNVNLENKFEDGVALHDREEGCNIAYRNASSSSSSSDHDAGNFLCFGCAPGYSHAAGDLSGKCDQCPGPGENEVIAVLGVLLGIVALFVYVKITLGDGGSKDASDGVKSIGLSFVQILSLLTTFPIAWPRIFTALFQIGGAVTVLGQHLVNLKCMFPERSEAEVFYASQIAWAVIPIALLGACGMAWLVVDLVCGAKKRMRKKEREDDEEAGGAEDHQQLQQPRRQQEEQQEQEQQEQLVIRRTPLTLRQKIAASMVALLYLIWPNLCSTTFGLFACRNLCGETTRTRLRADLSEFCFQGRHAAYAFGVGLPMLLIYVLGLPVGALFMVRRLRRRAERNDKRVDECKGHSTWGLFYSAFRDDTWW